MLLSLKWQLGPTNRLRVGALVGLLPKVYGWIPLPVFSTVLVKDRSLFPQGVGCFFLHIYIYIYI